MLVAESLSEFINVTDSDFICVIFLANFRTCCFSFVIHLLKLYEFVVFRAEPETAM